ncbi:MAG: hypothetical protein J5644_05435 [Bacteroidales bacterium]|nr:hypothetical protein [Bacteroidales bacterium]
MPDNQIKKEKRWLYFAIGLIVGFLISAAAFVVFAMIQSQSKSFTKTIEHIYRGENSKDTVVKYVNVVRKEAMVSATDEPTQPQDSMDMVELPETYDEVDFSYVAENQGDEDVVAVDKILAQKTVKVRFKNAEFKDVAAEEGTVGTIEVQQWNTPIKNRITYRFTGNMLQVKGLDVDKMEIIHYDQHYYLSHHGNYYLLENNNTFEKLGSPVVLAVQK